MATTIEKRLVNVSGITLQQKRRIPEKVIGPGTGTEMVRKPFILFFENENQKMSINGKGLEILKTLLQNRGYELDITAFKEKEIVGISNKSFIFLRSFLIDIHHEIHVTRRKHLRVKQFIDNIKTARLIALHPTKVLNGMFLNELKMWAQHFGHEIKNSHILFKKYNSESIVMADAHAGPMLVEREFNTFEKLYFNFFQRGAQVFLRCSNHDTNNRIDLQLELKAFNYLNNYNDFK